MPRQTGVRRQDAAQPVDVPLLAPAKPRRTSTIGLARGAPIRYRPEVRLAWTGEDRLDRLGPPAAGRMEERLDDRAAMGDHLPPGGVDRGPAHRGLGLDTAIGLVRNRADEVVAAHPVSAQRPHRDGSGNHGLGVHGLTVRWRSATHLGIDDPGHVRLDGHQVDRHQARGRRADHDVAAIFPSRDSDRGRGVGRPNRHRRHRGGGRPADPQPKPAAIARHHGGGAGGHFGQSASVGPGHQQGAPAAEDEFRLAQHEAHPNRWFGRGGGWKPSNLHRRAARERQAETGDGDTGPDRG